MKYGPVAITLVAFASLLGCNPQKRIHEAEKAVDQFHTHYDAGTPELIYRDADPVLKSAHTESKLVAFVSGVRQKLGKTKSTSHHGAKAFSNTSESNVVLVYSTQFERGTGKETFTYRVSGNHAALVSWFIDSPELTEDPSKSSTTPEAAPAPASN